MTIWTQEKDAGYCYLIVYDNGFIKIGKTVEPHRRFGAHRNKAKIEGKSIASFYLTELVGNHHKTEASMLDIISLVAAREGLEVFSGIEPCNALGLLEDGGILLSEVSDFSALKRMNVIVGTKPVHEPYTKHPSTIAMQLRMLDAKKIGFAKVALGISSSEKLASEIKMGAATIRRIEANDSSVRSDTLDKARQKIDELLLINGWRLISGCGIGVAEGWKFNELGDVEPIEPEGGISPTPTPEK